MDKGIRIVSTFAALLLLAAPNRALGQAGDQKDRAGEQQEMRMPLDLIPEAPVLTPAQAMETFEIAPGFELQLVASEPLVQAPVAMEFGPDGSLWIVEMTGYMPNVDGVGEQEPVGKIVRLFDRDSDGTMDERTVFMDGLVMPRALCLVDGGALVAEPPFLYFAKDTDGDGKADWREVVDDNYGSQANPEHTANGLMWGLDNWIYSANHNKRYRYNQGQWVTEDTVSRGQWGISQDNYGRIYYNSNSDQLRLDLFPSEFLSRNPNLGRALGVAHRTTSDQRVWPIRVNPGVNRGYRRGTMRDDDHTLQTYTAASGPVVFRGAALWDYPETSAFVPEPSGNLVRRNRLIEIEGVVSAQNAYFQSEFLASTDERFRPVNLYNGPDGGLYIVDFYRGLIQHRIYLTTYLRQQILDRELELPLSYGRIYRAVPTDHAAEGPQSLSGLSTSELVSALGASYGWTRDTAQRLLVERADAAAAPLLWDSVTEASSPLARLHALWALEGINALDADRLATATRDGHPVVRAHALRLLEAHLAQTDEALSPTARARISALARDPDFGARAQAMFTLGAMRPEGFWDDMRAALYRGVENEWFRQIVISGLQGFELEALQSTSTDSEWALETEGRREWARLLASCVAAEASANRVDDAIELAAATASQSNWLASAILEGLTPPERRRNDLGLGSEPGALLALASGDDRGLSSKAQTLLERSEWPGKPNEKEPEVEVIPLTADEQAIFAMGKALYPATCGACHQLNGMGQDGLAPPLVDSEWATGSEARAIRIVLQGVSGPIDVNGKTYNLLMPGLQTFTDEQLSSLLTYVRREWGHTASAITADEVAAVRAATSGRQDMWSAAELMTIE